MTPRELRAIEARILAEREERMRTDDVRRASTMDGRAHNGHSPEYMRQLARYRKQLMNADDTEREARMEQARVALEKKGIKL